MQTKLISVTKSYVIGIDTPEELIVYTARVSNPENQMNMETSDRLIKYLIIREHTRHIGNTRNIPIPNWQVKC